jgi:hypothetical protein
MQVPVNAYQNLNPIQPGSIPQGNINPGTAISMPSAPMNVVQPLDSVQMPAPPPYPSLPSIPQPPVPGVAPVMSDANAKTNIEPLSNSDIQNFLGNIGSYKYNYIDPKNGVGQFVSPMAQDIEKTEIGKSAIETNKEGYKMVNYGRLSGIQLAITAHLNKRMNDFDAKMKNVLASKFLSKKDK